MEIKADEITAILKQQLAGYEKAIDVAEVLKGQTGANWRAALKS